jgi:hypothetical protein
MRPMPEIDKTNIACRCGAVRAEVVAAPLAQFYCHCDDCQAMHGAAYVSESVYPADAVRIVAGTPAFWTLKSNPRAACPRCATRLFIDVLRLKLRGVSGYLLPPGAFTPAFHMNCRYAVRPVQDGLPHYAGRPPQFAGSDERVEW